MKKVEGRHGSILQIDKRLRKVVSCFFDNFGSGGPDTNDRRSLYRTLSNLLCKCFPPIDFARRGERNWDDLHKYFNCVGGLVAGARVLAPDDVDFMSDDLPFAGVLVDAARYQYETRFDVRALPLLQRASCICRFPYTEAEKMTLKSTIHSSAQCLLSAYCLLGGIRARGHARSYAAEAIKTFNQFWASGCSIALRKLRAAVILSHSSDVLMQAEQIVEASTDYDILLETYEQNDDEQQNQFRLARARLYKAFILICQGGHRVGDALQIAEKAFQILETRVKTFAHCMLWFRFLRALLLFNCGVFDESWRAHSEVLKMKQLQLGETDHETLSSQYCVAVCEMWGSKLVDSE